MTRTFATLQVSEQTFFEIRRLLIAAGQPERVMVGPAQLLMVMDGIALVPAPSPVVRAHKKIEGCICDWCNK